MPGSRVRVPPQLFTISSYHRALPASSGRALVHGEIGSSPTLGFGGSCGRGRIFMGRAENDALFPASLRRNRRLPVTRFLGQDREAPRSERVRLAVLAGCGAPPPQDVPWGDSNQAI